MESNNTKFSHGDVIGQKYFVHSVLGRGGCGIVYLVKDLHSQKILALKTVLDEYIDSPDIRNRFWKEAAIWIELGRHPFIVQADHVEERSGRLFIAMEFVAPNESGLYTLEDYIIRDRPRYTQILKWCIQFCIGMEYAYTKGLKSHRDIKPSNILISQDRKIKISDFGLAAAFSSIKPISYPKKYVSSAGVNNTVGGNVIGTPAYMSPEQFNNASNCDMRSDIYSFGIVVYQLIANGKLPYNPIPPNTKARDEIMRFILDYQRMHCEAAIPEIISPLFPIVNRCIEKMPIMRYQRFEDIRLDLELLLKHETNEIVLTPKLVEFDGIEWRNKGNSAISLGLFDDGIKCFEKALEINPKDSDAWCNKGTCLFKMGRIEDAMNCYKVALKIEPSHEISWIGMGNCLDVDSRFGDAISCYDKALFINKNSSTALANKGNTLASMGRCEDTINCFNESLRLDPYNSGTWLNKGNSLFQLNKFGEAIRCFDKTLEIDPNDSHAWNNKGNCFFTIGELHRALECYKKAVESDSSNTQAHKNRSIVERKINENNSETQINDLVDSNDISWIFVERFPVSFYISSTPVTFAQYDKFCEATGYTKPDAKFGRGRQPVINVNVEDAHEYCNWLSEETGENIRLPEADEWEFAAKGGKKSQGYIFSGGNYLDEVGWYEGNSGKTTHPVGQKKPNELGIYDMSGNVYEWVGSIGAIRGGAWDYCSRDCRVNSRSDYSRESRYIYFGFRVLREIKA